MATRKAYTLDDVIDLLEEARPSGWNFRKTSRGIQVFPPKGGPILQFTYSSESHAMRNTIASLRRAGFVFPEDEVKSNTLHMPAAAADSPPPYPGNGAIASAVSKDDPLTRIETRIAAAFDLLAEIEQDCKALRASSAKESEEVARIKEIGRLIKSL